MQYLRNNQGVFEASSNGTDWKVVVLGTGGGGGVTDHTALTNIGTHSHADIDTFMATPPTMLGNPVTIGFFQIRDNSGDLQFSDDGEEWSDFYGMGWDLNLTTSKFFPPLKSQTTDPTGEIWNNSLVIWENTSDNTFWIVFKNSAGVAKKIQLT